MITDLKNSLVNSSKELKAEIKAMKSDIFSMNNSMDQVKENTCSIQPDLTKLANRITLIKDKASNLEETIRKCEKKKNEMARAKNIIIYNLEESIPNDSLDTLEETLKNIFVEKLKINLDSSDIDYIQPIGKKGNQKRSILVKFTRLLMKPKVLRSANLLKDTNITISQDYSKEVRDNRKMLYPFLKKVKMENLSQN